LSVMSSENFSVEPVALTIAGFDPSGGAGVIADIRTFLAFGCIPTAAITSLTFQNSAGVFGAIHQTAESLRAQVLPITGERCIAAAKTGMLPTRGIVVEVARLFREAELPAPVVDPVLRSSSGYSLMEEDGIEVLVRELMPLARVITPNIPEAERLTGLRIDNEDAMRDAARKLREMGARAVLVKGGHLKQWAVGSGQWAEGQKAVGSGQWAERQKAAGSRQGTEKAEAIDVLDDQGSVTVFRGDWIDAPPVRGTGCMLSAAMAACLGKGMNLEEAVGEARKFVRRAIRKAD
jgi:hydroxymethylpyrimidine kinase/phosphomethylpyrimidine kinase